LADSLSVDERQKPDGDRSSEIKWYKHKMIQTAQLSGATTEFCIDDYGIDRIDEPCIGTSKQVILLRPLTTSMSAATDSFLPELYTRCKDFALLEEKIETDAHSCSDALSRRTFFMTGLSLHWKLL